MFIEVIVIRNNRKENRLINLKYIRQILETDDENKIKIDLSGHDEFIFVESTLKEFKIKINQIKK